MALFGIWKHLGEKIAFATICVLVSISLLVFTDTLRIGRILFFNLVYRQPFPKAKVIRRHDIVEILITLPRPWRIQPGQYVYLWAPAVSFGALVQMHPFSVAWWQSGPDGNATSISLLVKPQRGFTEKLVRCAGNDTWMRVGLDGPYGGAAGIRDFGSVTMFATGIGIAQQIPFIKHLLQTQHDGRGSIRRMSLVWQLDQEGKVSASDLPHGLILIDGSGPRMGDRMDGRAFASGQKINGTSPM